MGSPLSPVLANICMEMFESEYLPLIPERLRPFFWVRYVDDIFIIYDYDDDSLNEFLALINNLIPSIKFTTEIEESHKLAFLDVCVTHTNGQFQFNVYRKNTNTESYIHNFSFHSKQIKQNVISNLFSRAFKICDNEFVDSEIEHISNTFLGLGYPKHFIQKSLSIAKKRFYAPTTAVDKERQKRLVLPYSKKLENFGKYIKYDKDVDVVFRFDNTIRKKLVKNKLEKEPQDKGVYTIPCKDCDKLYVGETGRNLAVRLDEHRRACSVGQENNAVAVHSISLDHRINFRESKVICKEPNVTKRRIIEGALIHSLDTFKNNKSFSKEDDLISNFITFNILKFKKVAHISVDSSLSFAQAQDENPDAGTDAGNERNLPPSNPQAVRRSQRIRNRPPRELDPD